MHVALPPALLCRSNCRARLQQHNSRRRKVTAIGQELRQGRYGGQQDSILSLPTLPGDGQPWQWPGWPSGPAGPSLLPLSVSNGSLSGLDAIDASGGASGGLPPLPGLSLPLPLPPLPQPGVPPPPDFASTLSGSGPAYGSAFAAAAGSLAGQSMGPAPLTGKDWARTGQGLGKDCGLC